MPGDFVQMDLSELRRLGSVLRKARPDVYRAARLAMLAEGAHMVEDAKSRASWSTRIPGTIKVVAEGIMGLKLVAGGGKNSAAPHAKPYEHGGKSGTFRHPVDADPTLPRNEWAWVDEEARPFLHPAVMENLQATADAAAEAVAMVVEAYLE